MSEALRAAYQSTLKALQEPITDIDHLAGLLLPPLRFLGLSDQGVSALPWGTLDISLRSLCVPKFWPGLQSLLLRRIYVDWVEQLQQDQQLERLLEPYFCPAGSSTTASLVALSATDVILALIREDPPLHPLSLSYAFELLQRILQYHNLADIYDALLQEPTPTTELRWREATKLYFSIPDRAANAAASRQVALPADLEWKHAMSTLALACTNAISSSSSTLSAAAPLAKIINSGFLASQPTSLWTVVLPSLWPQIFESEALSQRWIMTAEQLSTRETQALQSSLMRHLLQADYSLQPFEGDPYSTSQKSKRAVAASAKLFRRLFGSWSASAAATFVDRQGWSIICARAIHLWAAVDGFEEEILSHCVESWSDSTVMERATVEHHQYLTLLMLLNIQSVPRQSPILRKLSSSETFLNGVQAHLKTSQVSVRLLGMLAAETTSQRTLDPQGPVKPLDFGPDVWAGQQPGIRVCNEIRGLLHDSAVTSQDVQDAAAPKISPSGDPAPVVQLRPAEQPLLAFAKPANLSNKSQPPPAVKSKVTVLSSSTLDDSEDDLQPYAMPAEDDVEQLSEHEDLSALTPAKNRPKPPIYITDLSAYLKSHEDADKIEIALKSAASLIRKRAHFGSELDEHAVDLAITLIGMHNNFDLNDFSQQRQDALTAVVACALKFAAPAIIEQYYTPHYSVDQRFAILTSLALAARELAGLEAAQRTSTDLFPSKKLPPHLHQKLVEFEAGPLASTLDQLASGVAAEALGSVRADAALEHGPTDEQRQETRLNVQQPQTRRSAKLQVKSGGLKANAFAQVAESCFIMPLINRMWLALHHAGSLEALFVPLLLARFFSTLSLLTHASSHATSLQKLLPEVLGLTLALRGASDESEVVAAQMETLLVALQTAHECGTERSLMREMDSREMVFRLKDWAQVVWQAEEGKGSSMGRLGRNAAGVLLRAESMSLL